MPVTFLKDKPIFLQLASIIKSDIMSGKYKTNEKLPSVRELAMIYSINPNTVQKALQIIEDEGLIVTDRTNGKYVSENLKEIEQYKTKLINEEVTKFIEKMSSLGVDKSEVIELINRRGE